ncbi:MAG: hypothetical protein QOE68_4353, partial [Thermoanaerobaculia bacterium]|nr:hypothetical protein [Thermoanaerobaculia bacterium]
RDWNGDMLDAEKFEEAKANDKQSEREAKRVTAPKPSHDLAAFAGTYHNAGFGDATITVADGALTLHWERLTIPLVHENNDTFSAIDTTEDIDEPVQFRIGADGSVVAFTLFGEEFVLLKKQS